MKLLLLALSFTLQCALFSAEDRNHPELDGPYFCCAVLDGKENGDYELRVVVANVFGQIVLIRDTRSWDPKSELLQSGRFVGDYLVTVTNVKGKQVEMSISPTTRGSALLFVGMDGNVKGTDKLPVNTVVEEIDPKPDTKLKSYLAILTIASPVDLPFQAKDGEKWKDKKYVQELIEKNKVVPRP